MTTDFSGGAITDLLHTILNDSENVTIKNPSLLTHLNSTLVSLNQDLIDGAYEQTDDADDTYQELEAFYKSLTKVEDDDDLIVLDEDEEDDEDEEFDFSDIEEEEGEDAPSIELETEDDEE